MARSHPATVLREKLANARGHISPRIRRQVTECAQQLGRARPVERDRDGYGLDAEDPSGSAQPLGACSVEADLELDAATIRGITRVHNRPPLLIANVVVMSFIVANHSLCPATDVSDRLLGALPVTAPR